MLFFLFLLRLRPLYYRRGNINKFPAGIALLWRTTVTWNANDVAPRGQSSRYSQLHTHHRKAIKRSCWCDIVPLKFNFCLHEGRSSFEVFWFIDILISLIAIWIHFEWWNQLRCRRHNSKLPKIMATWFNFGCLNIWRGKKLLILDFFSPCFELIKTDKR